MALVENSRVPINLNTIKKIWEDAAKKIRKEIIAINSQSFESPSEIAHCSISITDVCGADKVESLYLNPGNKAEQSKDFMLGFATLPVDVYVEYIVEQMVLGEKSECTIGSVSGSEIKFTCELLEIYDNPLYFELPQDKMYDLALKFKDAGVKMFRSHPTFAQNYFSKSAKCLLSLSVLKDLEISADINKLLANVYVNLAACLLKQDRNEDVLYLLKSDEQILRENEKAIYRLAVAHTNLKNYADAKKTLELWNYRENASMLALWNRIEKEEKITHASYSSICKKMFN